MGKNGCALAMKAILEKLVFGQWYKENGFPSGTEGKWIPLQVVKKFFLSFKTTI